MSSASVVASVWPSVSFTVPHDRDVLGVGWQRVGGDHPSPLRGELGGDVELVVVVLSVELERDQRQLLLAG